jgi:predicted phosphodiesterase
MIGPATKAVVMVPLVVLAACRDDTVDTTSTTRETAETSSTAVRPTLTTAEESRHVLVVGDWGAGTDSQQEVAEEMSEYARQQEVDVIVTTGDNFYSDDADELMEPFGWATEAGIPFWITWGNHDVESSRIVDEVEETFDSPPRRVVHEWGPIDVVVLDSNQAGSEDQEDFLIEALGASEDPTIVVFHHAAYSCGSHGDSETIIEEWVPRFDDDVFLVLNGHEHNYQRFEHDGVTYVVTGGGGATLTDLRECPDDHPQRIAGEAAHHFVALRLNDSLTVTAIDLDGNVVDEFSLTLP